MDPQLTTEYVTRPWTSWIRCSDSERITASRDFVCWPLLTQCIHLSLAWACRFRAKSAVVSVGQALELASEVNESRTRGQKLDLWETPSADGRHEGEAYTRCFQFKILSTISVGPNRLGPGGFCSGVKSFQEERSAYSFEGCM